MATIQNLLGSDYVDESLTKLNSNFNNLNTDKAEQSELDAHEEDTSNPHSVTKEQVGLGSVPNLDTTEAVANEHTHNNKAILDEIEASLSESEKLQYQSAYEHITNKENPHEVTKDQVGLGNVDNTSDANKPISEATATALGNKVDNSTLISSLATKADKTNVLEKDNTTDFTPTEEYHPATKKYVDEQNIINTVYDTDTIDLQLLNRELRANITSPYVSKINTAYNHTLDFDNPHEVTKADVGLNLVDNEKQIPYHFLDTDIRLTLNSDLKVPSQRAIKTYVDGIVYGQGYWLRSGTTLTPFNSGDALDMINGNIVTTGTITASNFSGVNTGDQDLSGLIPYTGATGDLNLGLNSIYAANGYINDLLNLGSGCSFGWKGETGSADVFLTSEEARKLKFTDSTYSAGFVFDYTGVSGESDQIITIPNLTGTMALTEAGLTAGSVLFIGASGLLSQDNTQFFYDSTNKFIGVGTNAPLGTLHLVQPGASAGLFIERDGVTATQTLSGNFFGLGNQASKFMVGLDTARKTWGAGITAPLAKMHTKASQTRENTVFTGTGLNDITIGGTYNITDTIDETFVLTVIGNGTPNTFNVTKNGVEVVASKNMTTGASVFADGLTAKWASTTGHTIGESWTITITVDNPFYADDSSGNRLVTILNNGKVGIGTATPSFQLQNTGSISALDGANGVLFINSYNNYDIDPTVTYPIATFARVGKSGTTYSSQMNVGVSRYENVGTNARTQVDFRLSHGEVTTPETLVLTLRSSQTVGINSSAPKTSLEIRNHNEATGDMPGSLSSRSVGLSIYSNPLSANTRPGIVQYGLRLGDSGIAYSIQTAYIGTTEANVMKAFTLGTFGEVYGSGSHIVNYAYMSAASDGTYDKAAIKITPLNRIGININSTYQPVSMLHVMETDGSSTMRGIVLDQYSADNSGAANIQRKSRSATAGLYGRVQNNDTLASWQGYGSGDSDFYRAGMILIAVDGTPGAANDMPGRITFWTTPDGSATAAERMRIDNAGKVSINTTTMTEMFNIGAGSILLDYSYALKIKDSGGTARIALYHGSTGTTLRSVETTGISFENSSGTRMGVYTNTGYFGIGITAPGTMLDIDNSRALPTDLRLRGAILLRQYAQSAFGAKGVNQLVAQGTLSTPTAIDTSAIGEVGIRNFFYDGGWRAGATIRSYVSAVVANTSVASGLEFSGGIVTGDASAGSTTGLNILMRLTPEGNLGIGTISPLSTYSGIDISSGGLSLVIGADSGANTRTDTTSKIARISSVHYTNAEEPVSMMVSSNTSTQNILNIGGGSSLLNSATDIIFLAAANTTTTSGTEIMRIKSAGIGIGTSSPSALLHLYKTSAGELQRIESASQSAWIDFREAGTNRGYLGYGDGGSVFTGADADSMALRATGSLHLGASSTIGLTLKETTNNVGIGTTNPLFKLQIDGSSATTYSAFALVNTNTGANAQINQDFRLTGDDSVVNTGGYILVGKEQLWTSTATTRDSYMAFWTRLDNTLAEKARITSLGYLGINTIAPNSTLHTNGSFAAAYVAKTADYTATVSDYVIDCTANSFTITLPTAVGIGGRIYHIKNTGTGLITIDAAGTETIDGELTRSISQWEVLTIQSTGANWIIL